MSRRLSIGALALTVGALALVAAGCGGSKKSGSGGGGGGGSVAGKVTALPASSCAKLESKATPDLLLVSDLPMQGSSRTQTVQMVQAIKYVLDQRGWKAGKYNIGYQVCDDATAQAG
ncbi:MAG: branched-chain amino acid transport system substrate-binding protein, partial [Gaiellaceae bacterium]|nr:branched-chain amino acid transport system substrate-binding protein [Gaiellaceae bacterium]